MNILFFLAGLSFFNSIPHITKGITGQTHMTPFKRVSDPLVNITWGFMNILLSLFILGIINGTAILAWPWQVNFTFLNTVLFLFGAVFISLMDANLFKNPNARLPWHKD